MGVNMMAFFRLEEMSKVKMRPLGLLPSLGAQHRLATDGFVENLASVSWHRLARSEAADRAHQHRLQKNVDHIDAKVTGYQFITSYYKA